MAGILCDPYQASAFGNSMGELAYQGQRPPWCIAVPCEARRPIGTLNHQAGSVRTKPGTVIIYRFMLLSITF
jgi:hypothetical protein